MAASCMMRRADKTGCIQGPTSGGMHFRWSPCQCALIEHISFRRETCGYVRLHSRDLWVAPVASAIGIFVDAHVRRGTDILVVWYDFLLCVFLFVSRYEFIRGEFPFFTPYAIYVYSILWLMDLCVLFHLYRDMILYGRGSRFTGVRARRCVCCVKILRVPCLRIQRRCSESKHYFRQALWVQCIEVHTSETPPTPC